PATASQLRSCRVVKPPETLTTVRFVGGETSADSLVPSSGSLSVVQPRAPTSATKATAILEVRIVGIAPRSHIARVLAAKLVDSPFRPLDLDLAPNRRRK